MGPSGASPRALQTCGPSQATRLLLEMKGDVLGLLAIYIGNVADEAFATNARRQARRRWPVIRRKASYELELISKIGGRIQVRI